MNEIVLYQPSSVTFWKSPVVPTAEYEDRKSGGTTQSSSMVMMRS